MAAENRLNGCEKALELIRSNGAFLTVRSGSAINTMTIGWALFGTIWGKPIVAVTVRPSRFTFSLIDKSNDFTISAPTGDMRRQLNYCGTRSGRDGDKFAACGLQTIAGRSVESPVIDAPALHYEGKIVLKTPMDPALLIKDYATFYAHGDYHTLYYAEIINSYETK
jgi:flavin reductase (DIM6/NTAB) family NADH-FMN oxidoreductase RutF